MTNPSWYDPEQLQRRLQEIDAGTGEPYVPGEDPAVDAAMLLKDANHPALSEEKMLAIGAGLLMTASTLHAPTLSTEAFNNIEAMLQAQLQLQNAPQPAMSDEAVNAIDAQLRLQNTARPVMSKDALLRVEQQLLRTTRPTAPFATAAAVLLALIGFLFVAGTILGDTFKVIPVETEEIVETPVTVEATIPDVETVEPTVSYTSEIVVVVAEPAVEEQEAPINPEPSPEVEIVPSAEPSLVPTLANIVDVLQLPPALVLEGPIEALEDGVVVIYDLPFNYGHDATLLDGYSVGDTVHIEGAVIPNTDTYLILSIEPVYDGPPNRPVIISSVGDEPDGTIDTTEADGGAPVTSATGVVNTDTPSTSGSAGSEPPATTDCGDGADPNQGQGQECNQGSQRP